MAYYLLLFVTGQEERVPDSLSYHQERDHYVPVWSYIFLCKEAVWQYIYFVITVEDYDLQKLWESDICLPPV